MDESCFFRVFLLLKFCTIWHEKNNEDFKSKIEQLEYVQEWLYDYSNLYYENL